MTVEEILRQSRDYLADPAHWTKCAYARDAEGKIVGVTDPTVAQRCLVGTVQYVGALYQSMNDIKAVHVLNGVVPNGAAALFNDENSTTHDDVMAVLAKAITIASTQGI